MPDFETRALIIENPLQLVYWNIRRFLAVVLSIQIGLWCVVALETFGVTVPLARPILGFFYVIFVPGSMALRLFNVRRLNSIELLTYSTGLSIALVMLVGLATNSLFAVLHLPGPLTVGPLLIAMGALISVLCIVCYVRNDATYGPNTIETKELLTPPIVSVSVLPFLAILGTWLFNNFGLSAVNMAIIALIAVLIIVIGFTKFIPTNLYPFVLFALALTLILRNSLVSNYIWGVDIHLEYYVANLVSTSGFWNIHAPIGTATTLDMNIMLGTVILAPVLSALTGLSLDWVFKIIYPLIYSFVPLVLYVLFKKQTNPEIAFYAALLFITSFAFYTEMFALPRQQIGELFLSLLFLLMISVELPTAKRTVLSIVFAASLAVSHYSLTYIFIYLLLFSLVLLALSPLKSRLERMLRRGARLEISFGQEEQATRRGLGIDRTGFSLWFYVFLLVLAFVWFAFLNGAPLHNFVGTLQSIATSSPDILNPSATQPLGIVSASDGPMKTVTLYLYYALSFFAILGMVSVLFKRNTLRIRSSYTVFALGAFVMLIACLTLPRFAESLNTTRFFAIAELLLAPIMVIGMTDVLGALCRAVKGFRRASRGTPLTFVSVFLALFLLFNSGFMYTLTNEQVATAAVISTNPNYTYPRWTDGEVASAEWLHGHTGDALIYTHGYYWLLIARLDESRVIPLNDSTNALNLNLYLFVGAPPNIPSQQSEHQTADVIPITVVGKSRIFSSGDVRIYY